MSTIHTTIRPKPIHEIMTDERLDHLASAYREYREAYRVSPQAYPFYRFLSVFGLYYVLLPHLNWKGVLRG